MRVCWWLWCVTMQIVRSPCFIVAACRRSGKTRGLLVKLVLADVARHSGREERACRFGAIPAPDGRTDLGGADFHVEAGQNVELGHTARGIAQRAGAKLDAGRVRLRRRAAAVKDETRRDRVGKVVKALPRAGSDDQR